jgi:predicted 3-demethylubiquinone-9 3-methyltransferase (glyoxalase superfamily)
MMAKQEKPQNFIARFSPNSKILSDNGMVVKFELNGREFMGLNGGPNFKFDEAVSFCIECETQEEIDYYWENLLKMVAKRKFAVG